MQNKAGVGSCEFIFKCYSNVISIKTKEFYQGVLKTQLIFSLGVRDFLSYYEVKSHNPHIYLYEERNSVHLLHSPLQNITKLGRCPTTKSRGQSGPVTLPKNKSQNSQILLNSCRKSRGKSLLRNLVHFSGKSIVLPGISDKIPLF